MKRCIFLLSVFFIGLIFAVIHKPTVETDILKSVVTQENKLLFDVNRHINSDIIVMFKDESKEKFLNDLTQKHLGQVVSEDFSVAGVDSADSADSAGASTTSFSPTPNKSVLKGTISFPVIRLINGSSVCAM